MPFAGEDALVCLLQSDGISATLLKGSLCPNILSNVRRSRRRPSLAS
jgi:hypothetical protein